MVVVPLTSCVVDGQTKWTLMSEMMTRNNRGMSHKAEKSHKCNICSYSTSLWHNLQTHMRRHISEKLFKCDQCSYAGNQRGILDIHVRSVHNDLWYKCEVCDFKASQKCNLKTHIQLKHEGMMYYKCDQCSYKACKKQKLDKHMQESVHAARPAAATHAGKLLKCDKCDYDTVSG